METNKEIVKQGFAHWANGTGSFFDLLTDDLQWTITGCNNTCGNLILKQQRD